MKIFLKRDTSTSDSLFTVFDELCKEKYFVTRSKNTIRIVDLSDSVVMKIKRMPLISVNAYSLIVSGKSVRLIINPNDRLYYYGLPWHIRGELMTKSFDIIDADNSLVATHCERFSKLGDGYELNIRGEDCELFWIGTAVCVNLTQRVKQPKLQTV